MKDSITVALLSFAHDHQFHWARAFDRDPGVRISAAWDSDPERGRQGAGRVKTQFQENLDSILSDSSIDAVAICAETNRHRDLTLKACKAGKHVLCEKPMAMSVDECKSMIDAVEESGITYMQAFPQRHIPSNREIKVLLESGSVGKVSLVKKRHGHGFAFQGLAEGMPWIVDPRQAGQGGLLDEGIHECDVLRWYFGNPVEVTALTANCLEEISPFGIDDTGVAVFRFAGGEIGVLQAGWGWVAGGPTTEIYGSKGTIIQSLTDCASNAVPLAGIGHLQVFRTEEKDRGWQRINCDWDFSLSHEAVAESFIHCLGSGSPPPVTAEDGMEAVRMMAAAYESAKSGRTVRY